MSQFGQQIRQIRQQKGFGLNEFAKELGVSPAYLSNLETGKTQTIQLEVLSKLQQGLHLNVDELDSKANPVIRRAERVSELLLELHKTNPVAANYFMMLVEQGVEMFPLQSSDIH